MYQLILEATVDNHLSAAASGAGEWDTFTALRIISGVIK
jgi:hypothetical protein